MIESIDSNARFEAALQAYQEAVERAREDSRHEIEALRARDWLIAVIDGHVYERLSLSIRAQRAGHFQQL